MPKNARSGKSSNGSFGNPRRAPGEITAADYSPSASRSSPKRACSPARILPLAFASFEGFCLGRGVSSPARVWCLFCLGLASG